MIETMDLFQEIARLKKEKNAIILAHYYQNPDIQDIADHIGDSLELAKIAQSSHADIILFAGVHFMAEGAKILNPKSKVLLPDMRAGCSLSDSCPPQEFKKFCAQFNNPFVVSYINCSAEVKALSNIICTSSNALKIISQIPKDREIVFGPDRNLGAWLEKQTGRKMHLWQGACIVHETFSERKIIELQTQYPESKLIAHPECEESLLNQADFIGSTSQLLKFTEQSDTQVFIVATEEGILHQMQKKSPNKKFIPAPPTHACACNECPFMKLNTLEKIYDVLTSEKNEMLLPEDLMFKALHPLTKMLEWSTK